MSVRAKFKTTARTQFAVSVALAVAGAIAAPPPTSFRIEATAVRPTPNGEDSVFGKYTPSGGLTLGNLPAEAAEKLDPGKAFYVDFHPLDPAAVTAPPLPEGAVRVVGRCSRTGRTDNPGNYSAEVNVSLVGNYTTLPEDLTAFKASDYVNGEFRMVTTNEAAGEAFTVGALFLVDLVPTEDPSF